MGPASTKSQVQQSKWFLWNQKWEIVISPDTGRYRQIPAHIGTYRHISAHIGRNRLADPGQILPFHSTGGGLWYFGSHVSWGEGLLSHLRYVKIGCKELAVTFRWMTTDVADKPPSTINKLHEWIHVCLASVTTNRARRTVVNVSQLVLKGK